MDNHSSKTTNNYPPDGQLSYKKKAPIVIDAAKVRVVKDADATVPVEQDVAADAQKRQPHLRLKDNVTGLTERRGVASYPSQFYNQHKTNQYHESKSIRH